MTQTIVNLGTGGAVLNARNGSTTGADSNDALFLDRSDINYVYLPGVAGNSMSVPDEAALDITGDIDIRVQVALDDWTPAAASTVISKVGTAGNLAWYLRVLNTGLLQIFISPDGTTFFTRQSTVSTGITDGDVKWVRFTLDVDNGSSQNETKFFLSDDGVTWTQLGTTVTGSGTTTINANNSNLTIGIQGTTTQPAAGKVYRAQIYSDLTETNKVLDIDTSVITTGAATSFTALTGQTVTINRSTSGRKTVAVVSPVWLFGTDDYMEVADDALLDFGASESFTVVAVVRQWNNPAATQRLLSKKNGDGTAAGYMLHSSSGNAVVFDTGDGVLRSVDTQANIWSGALGIVSGVRVATVTVAAGFNGLVSGTTADGSVNSLANSGALRIAATGGGSGASSFADMELLAVAVFRRALTATEITAITTYYQARLS